MKKRNQFQTQFPSYRDLSVCSGNRIEFSHFGEDKFYHALSLFSYLLQNQ